MESKQNFADNVILQLTDEQLAEIAISKKEVEDGLFVDHKTLKKEVKTWLKER
ncbi:MAG: hypothetical protein IPH69_08520 [Bacteroidales bacterium]|nr:hypothetical protein [Bacteroidales bacterium]